MERVMEVQVFQKYNLNQELTLCSFLIGASNKFQS